MDGQGQGQNPNQANQQASNATFVKQARVSKVPTSNPDQKSIMAPNIGNSQPDDTASLLLEDEPVIRTDEETEGEETGAAVPVDESEYGEGHMAGVSAELERELEEAGKVAAETEFEFQDDTKSPFIDEDDSDEGGAKRIYAAEYMKAFAPIRWLFFWTFPFNIIQNSDNSFLVSASLSSRGGIGFIISTVFIVILCIATWAGMFSYFLELPEQKYTGTITPSKHYNTNKFNGRAEEIFLLHRNFPTLIVFLTSMFHIVIGNWEFYKKRREIAEYLTFWTEALHIIKIHATKGVRFRMVLWSILFIIFLLILLGLGCLHYTPVTSGAPGFFAHIIFRPYYPDFFSKGDEYEYARAVFGLIFIYIIFASNFYIFLYMFKCLLMKNTFDIWNSRLDEVVNRDDGKIVRGDRLGKRTGFKELYVDHVVLLDLIDGADTMFGETIESYFTAKTFSICFECYYLWRSISNAGEFPYPRNHDAHIVGLFLAHSVFIILTAASLSADVADSAMEGLEVIRRKGLFGRKSREELYFMMSLYSSYSGSEVAAISGAGYFVLDQSFLAVIIGTFLSYVIILFQFNPPMEFTGDRLVPLILERGKLVDHLEATPRINLRTNNVLQAMMMDFIMPTNFTMPESENLN